MKKKILIIALITLSIILVSIIVCASVMISLYNDRYGGTVYIRRNYSETNVKKDSGTFEEYSFLGVSFHFKYDYSVESNEDTEDRDYYVDKEGKYVATCFKGGTLGGANHKYKFAGIWSDRYKSAVFEYDKGEVIYDEYVDWLKYVIYELYETDVSEYVLSCETAYDNSESYHHSEDHFVSSSENGPKIRRYEFIFTQYINGFKTDNSFRILSLPDGGITYINRDRLFVSDISNNRLMLTELEYDEKKINRSIDVLLYHYYQGLNYQYMGKCEARDMTVKTYNGIIVLECTIYHAEVIRNEIKGEVSPFYVRLYISR